MAIWPIAFPSSSMLCRITWLLSHRRAPDETSASKLPLQTYHMLRGLETLFLRKVDYLTVLGYSYFAREEPVTLPEAVSEDISDEVNLIEKDLANLFKNFQCNFLPDSEKSVYQETADYISWLYKATLLGTEAGFLHRFISTMPLRLQPSFLSLLECYDPIAVALLARSLVLFRLVQYKWWLHGSGNYDFFRNNANSIRELLPTSYRWAVDWPCKVAVEKTGENTFEILRMSL
jgi:hypothetical protein